MKRHGGTTGSVPSLMLLTPKCLTGFVGILRLYLHRLVIALKQRQQRRVWQQRVWRLNVRREQLAWEWTRALLLLGASEAQLAWEPR